MNAVLLSMRLPFLILTPACVAVGVATAVAYGGPVDWPSLWLALVGALAGHIAVNTLNEYQDFGSGLDALTTRTPFSGGSGSLVQQPGAAGLVWWAALVSLVVIALVGVLLMVRHGLAILPLGLVGVAIILLYTRWLNRQPWLCLIAPGFAFGPLMVVGTHFVLTGQYSGFAAYASLVPFLVVNNLLLLNQYPDRQPDQSIGRRHLPIAYGLTFSTRVYGIMVALAAMVVLFGMVLDILPMLSGLTLIPLLGGAVAYIGAQRYGNHTENLIPFLGLNVVAAVGTPAVLAATVALGTPLAG